MEQTMQTVREQVVLFLPQLVVSILIFLAFWVGSGILRRIIHRGGVRAKLNKEVLELLEDLSRLVLITMGLLTALGTLGIDIAALVAGLGITGFALGFALQDVISNILAGILILIYRPFRTGNHIKVGDHEGTVLDINLRYTVLQGEAKRILIPNSMLFKEAIIVNEPGARPRETTIMGTTERTS
jgi:small conductance mechanosensitive channel